MSKTREIFVEARTVGGIDVNYFRGLSAEKVVFLDHGAEPEPENLKYVSSEYVHCTTRKKILRALSHLEEMTSKRKSNLVREPIYVIFNKPSKFFETLDGKNQKICERLKTIVERGPSVGIHVICVK